jgi:hypothetical protein
MKISHNLLRMGLKCLAGVVLLSGTLTLQSCWKDIINKKITTDWDPDMAVPLGRGDISIYDIQNIDQNSGLQVIDSNKMVELVYNGFVHGTKDSFTSNEVPVGKTTPPVTDTILLKLFTHAQKGDFRLVAPRLIISITNPFNNDVILNVNSIKSIDIRTGKPSDIIASNLFGPVTLTANSTTKVVVDNGNSNIAEVIDPEPKFIACNYTFSASAPVSGSGRIKFTYKAELPFWGWADGFEMYDTVDIANGKTKFGDIGSVVNDLEKATLIFKFENGFPVDINSRFIMLDNQHVVLDSIKDVALEFINSGIIDTTSGTVIQRSEKFVQIVLSQVQTQHLLDTKYLLINARASSTGADQKLYVKIFDSNKLYVGVAARVKGHIKFN